MRKLGPVGRYEIVRIRGEKIAVPGNSKPGIFAGLSTGLSVRGSYKKIGAKRLSYARSAKYTNQCCPPFNRTTGQDTMGKSAK